MFAVFLHARPITTIFNTSSMLLSSSASMYASFTTGKSHRWMLSGAVLSMLLDQVLIDLLCHERDHRRCCLADRNESGVKCHVRVDLILLHALCPETLTASSDIPVAHVIHKFIQCSCGLRDTGSLPRLSSTSLSQRNSTWIRSHLSITESLSYSSCIFCRVEVVDIRIQDKERVGVPECSHELSLSFLSLALPWKSLRQPWCAADIEIPADRVCAVVSLTRQTDLPHFPWTYSSSVRSHPAHDPSTMTFSYGALLNSRVDSAIRE